MQNNVKKIVAREFLFFLLFILISSISYFGIYVNNKYCIYKVSHLEIEIDSLEKPTNDKLDRYLWLISEPQHWYRGNVKRKKEWEKMELYLEDTLHQNKNYQFSTDTKLFIRNLGFSSPQKLKIYYDNLLSVNNEESNNYEIAKKLRIENTQLKSRIFYESEHNRITEIIVLCTFSLLFIVRYLYLSIKWSINTLKQKEE